MSGIGRWFERRRIERDLAIEMNGHIAEMAEDMIEAGQSPEQALQNARRKFGNVPLQMERSRDAWGWTAIGEFIADLRFGYRLLAKSPVFAMVAILTLALSIGASTAVFTVIDSVLLKPLGYRDSGDLVVAWERLPFLGPGFIGPNPRHEDLWKKRATDFTGMVMVNQGARGIALGLEHPRITGSVTAEVNLFDLLGVTPMMGRGFAGSDAVKGSAPVAVLSYALWQGMFRGDPNVIGKQARVGDTPTEIIGVLPESFRFPNRNALPSFNVGQRGSAVPEAGIFLPVALELSQFGWNSDYGNWVALGRLRSGIEIRQAQAQLTSIESEVGAQMRAHGAAEQPTVIVQPLQKAVVQDSERGLWLLMSAVIALLLIACLNLANTQLGRALTRRREAAVRSALGASKWRLVRVSLAENLLLAMAGGAAGVLLATEGVDLFRHYSVVDIPRLTEVHINLTVLAFSLAVTAGASILFGMLPALRLAHVPPQEALQANSGRTTGDRHSRNASRWLVGLEVAGCAALLTITGLFGKSLLHLMTQDRGFETQRVAVAQVDLSRQTGTDPAGRATFDDSVLDALHSIPGVESAGLVSVMPLEGESWIEGIVRSDSPQRDTPPINLRWASPGYFETTGQRLVAGRFFEERDRNLHSAVLSEGLAKKVWPDRTPLGAEVQIEGRKFDVIGIVADSRAASLKLAPPYMAYVHYRDQPPFTTIFMARGRQSGEAMVASVRQAIWSRYPDVAITRAKTLDAQLSDSIAIERFQTMVLVTFGGAALALAMLGIYGVMSCSVEGRRKEIGVRMAIGATRGGICVETLRESAMPVIAGLALGLLAGEWASREVRGLLYGVNGIEPELLLAVAALFVSVALMAGFLPARRAASVDPMDALRAE
jgi:predicted permease